MESTSKSRLGGLKTFAVLTPLLLALGGCAVYGPPGPPPAPVAYEAYPAGPVYAAPPAYVGPPVYFRFGYRSGYRRHWHHWDR